MSCISTCCPLLCTVAASTLKCQPEAQAGSDLSHVPAAQQLLHRSIACSSEGAWWEVSHTTSAVLQSGRPMLHLLSALCRSTVPASGGTGVLPSAGASSCLRTQWTRRCAALLITSPACVPRSVANGLPTSHVRPGLTSGSDCAQPDEQHLYEVAKAALLCKDWSCRPKLNMWADVLSCAQDV